MNSLLFLSQVNLCLRAFYSVKGSKVEDDKEKTNTGVRKYNASERKWERCKMTENEL